MSSSNNYTDTITTTHGVIQFMTREGKAAKREAYKTFKIVDTFSSQLNQEQHNLLDVIWERRGTGLAVAQFNS